MTIGRKNRKKGEKKERKGNQTYVPVLLPPSPLTRTPACSLPFPNPITPPPSILNPEPLTLPCLPPLQVGMSQMSAGSKTDVGAYHRDHTEATEKNLGELAGQFSLQDHR